MHGIVKKRSASIIMHVYIIIHVHCLWNNYIHIERRMRSWKDADNGRIKVMDNRLTLYFVIIRGYAVIYNIYNPCKR